MKNRVSIHDFLRLIKSKTSYIMKLLSLLYDSFCLYPPNPFIAYRKNIARPLISCICVTRARPILLARSIECFKQQTWPNKELVILYEDDDKDTSEFLATICEREIRVLEIRSFPKLSLGELRNVAIRASRGAFFSQWDDDDWFHPERLAVQFAYLRGNRAHACVLNHWIVFDGTTNLAYVSPEWTWEGSILCDKKVFSKTLQYENLSKGEDTVFLQKLQDRYNVALLNRPFLYIYIYHGHNTWEREHWDSNIISKCSCQLGDHLSEKIEEVLAGKLKDEAAIRILRSIDMITLVQRQT